MSTAVVTPTRISRMRTPDFNVPETSGSDRSRGQRFENEYYQFLKPESFTVLPPEAQPRVQPIPPPPRAPESYKLTPRKRHKNQAFSIIAEPGLSAPASRAASPTGRVSPFRGRGFNPTGSRHASPAPSPPPRDDPEDDAILRYAKELTSQLNKSSVGRSYIPVLSARKDRRSSAEDLLSPETSPHEDSPRRSNLESKAKFSRSMVNIAPRNLIRKPPPSPRRSNLKQSFVRLSPIIGSSPEAGSDQMSSPSRIPRTRSQPPSRVVSPDRATSRGPSRVTTPDRAPSHGPSRVVSPERDSSRGPSGVMSPDRAPSISVSRAVTPNRAPSRGQSRAPSRPVSRSTSRVMSPNRIPSRGSSRGPSRPVSRSTSREPSPGRSPSKIPMKNSVFRNIPAKVETFNRVVITSKPKVPQKPKVYSTRTNNVERKNSVRKNINSKISSNRSPRRDTDDTETTDSEMIREPVRSNGRSLSVSRRNSMSKSNTSTYSKQSTRMKYENEKPSTFKGSSRNESETSADQNDKSSTVNQSKTEKETQNGKRNHTNSQTFRKDDNGAKQTRNRKIETSTEELSKSEGETTEDTKDDDILSVTIDEFMGSQTTKIVSATAETVVKPLNIEAKLVTKSEEVNSGSKTISSASSNTTSEKTTDSATTNSNTRNTAANNHNEQSANSNNPPNSLHTPANGSVVNTPKNNFNEHNQTVPSAVAPSLNVSSEAVNNNLNNVSNSLTPSVNSLEMNAKNNFNNLTPPDSDKVSNKSLMDSTPLTNPAKLQGRTVIVDEIKPIKITVRERSGDIEVQSGNVLPRSATNGIAERPLIPPNHIENAESPPPDGIAKKGPCAKIFACCGRPKLPPGTADGSTVSGAQNLVPEEHEGEKGPPCWHKLCCKKSGKVGDINASRFSCFPKLKRGKNDENWAERRDSILSEPPKTQPFSLKRMLCAPCSKCKKKPEESVSRRPSMLSKKKSLSSTMQPPPEKNKKDSKDNNTVVKRDTGPKLDASLVEHTSHMKGAIPILPISLAWMCLIFNIFLPGTGTILSGLFCLCIGIPRFSPRDSAKARVGAFLIDIIVGVSQCFTVLFCLVGWGWSIWWGVIMHKISKKYKKIKIAEENAIEEVEEGMPLPTVNVQNPNQQRDVEKGS